MISRKSPVSTLNGLGKFAFALLFAACLMIQPGHAQTYTVLHRFTDGADGAVPYGGVTCGFRRKSLRHDLAGREQR